MSVSLRPKPSSDRMMSAPDKVRSVLSKIERISFDSSSPHEYIVYCITVRWQYGDPEFVECQSAFPNMQIVACVIASPTMNLWPGLPPEIPAQRACGIAWSMGLSRISSRVIKPLLSKAAYICNARCLDHRSIIHRLKSPDSKGILLLVRSRQACM